MEVELAERPDNVPPENVMDLDFYALPGAEDDFHVAWKNLQAPGSPAFIWTPRHGGHWIATRGRHIREILIDQPRFSNAAAFIPKSQSEHYNLFPLQSDQPEHSEYRRAVSKAVTPKFVVAMQEPTRVLARKLIQDVLARGHCEFISEFAEPLPIQLFLAFAGLPLEDFDRLRPLGSYLVRKDVDFGENEFQDLINSYLEPIVRERMERPGEDAMSRVIAEPVFGKPMTFDVAMGIARDLLLAGLDTVSSHIGFLGLHLARHPEHCAELVANPKLIPTAVDDLMRRYNSVTAGREAVEDVEIGGVTLRKGDVICVPLPLYNLDDDIFPDPMTTILDRRDGEHLGFGAGPHRCPGNSLARLELMIFLREWLDHIPRFEIDPSTSVRMKAGVVGAIDELHLRWPPAGA